MHEQFPETYSFLITYVMSNKIKLNLLIKPRRFEKDVLLTYLWQEKLHSMEQ